ncbi:branched-chain amino acid aminotransferase [Chitiniphilus purpureus]|uniref:Branched-chain-amino-acid aminotransferase n=1 Tax=Chitiniphilus purpureus TaxID=2981137 RepID=A0ABY6DIG2_9NEIS|nr:branched-chain amino acid aminotransferase [Chitiniphilus sp. CD1]UXY14135.1 branched-chain amino acid aminotransferase [Chitiniphilus sp. CD1]
MNIDIQVAAQRQTKPALSEVQFGSHVSDHMFVAEYDAGRGWHSPRVMPYGEFRLDPRALVLHYGQSVFEGLKAYRQADGGIALFRPGCNAARLNTSCARMAMPALPEALFIDGLQRLVALEAAWVPDTSGAALYARPVMFANEPVLGVRRSSRYVFCIMLCPVPPYFQIGDAPFKLVAREDCARTAQGGCGDAKTSANYGQTIVELERARREGYDNLLWLDAAGHRLIEEAGITNVFIRYQDKVVTPPLSGRILPGITRDSVIRLLRHQGVPVLEQETTIDGLVADIDDGRVREIFLTGTATIVAPVGEIGFRDRRHTLAPVAPDDSMAAALYRTLTAIQYGRATDEFGWMQRVPL